MKKTKKLLILLTCTALSTAPAVADTAYAAATEYTVQTTSGVAAVGTKSTSTKASTAKKKKIKPGWYTYKSGNKRYYNKKGQYYTAIILIPRAYSSEIKISKFPKQLLIKSTNMPM